VYLGSADWMERNLNRRVELVFEITDPDLKAQILDILRIMFSGNVKTRFLNAEGVYFKKELTETETGFNVQEFFLSLAESRQKKIDTTATPGLDL
jgi:polyphosphate kinase